MGFLDGQVAIVTGAAQGLGAAYAEALAGAGAKVVAVDEQTWAPGPSSASSVVADVSQIGDVRRVLDLARSEHGGVDILVNNAARWKQTPIDGPRQQALADYERLMDANTRGAFLMGRAVMPSMIERGGGNIVNVSTYYVLPPRPPESTGTNPPETDVYAASKWALNGLTQVWAVALREQGIRVNALAMGATDTPMLRGLYATRGTEPSEAEIAMWMTPAQQAQLLLDLLAEGPEGRTGETIGSWVGEPVALPPRRARGDAIV